MPQINQWLMLLAIVFVASRTANASEFEAAEGACNTGGTEGDGATFNIRREVRQRPSTTRVNGYSASLFNFVVIVPDDGTGDAGGWQAASVVFKVTRWVNVLPETWACPQLTFGAPLRNTAQGKISAQTAASVAALLATEVSHELKDIEQQGIYCIRLKEGLKARFPKLILGARVTQP